jgi:hypothetical protein
MALYNNAILYNCYNIIILYGIEFYVIFLREKGNLKIVHSMEFCDLFHWKVICIVFT